MITEYKNRIHVLVVAGVLLQIAAGFLIGFDTAVPHGTLSLVGFIVGAAGTWCLVFGFADYARAKGHNDLWGLLALVLGLVAIIILARLPDRTAEPPGADAPQPPAT
jgi:hypothetical protein